MTNPLLDKLAPIIEPTAPGLWPLAYGWWIVIGLSLALVVRLSISLVRWRQFWALKRLGQRQLKLCVTTDDINQLLKQLAIEYHGAPQVNSLQGKPWAGFLAAGLPQPEQRLDEIIRQLYGRESQQDFDDFKDIAQRWIKALSRNNIKKVSNA